MNQNLPIRAALKFICFIFLTNKFRFLFLLKITCVNYRGGSEVLTKHQGGVAGCFRMASSIWQHVTLCCNWQVDFFLSKCTYFSQQWGLTSVLLRYLPSYYAIKPESTVNAIMYTNHLYKLCENSILVLLEHSVIEKCFADNIWVYGACVSRDFNVRSPVALWRIFEFGCM